MARFKQEVYDALDKDASERTFWEKIQSAYAEPFIEADTNRCKKLLVEIIETEGLI